jgi:serine/threonine protein kinase
MTDTFGGRETDSEEGSTLLTVPKARSCSQRLPSWISEAIAPLAEFIVDVNPQEYFADLQEIAEGDSGSVYAARVVCRPEELGLPAEKTHVALKAIAVQPSMSPKLQDLRHEMELMRGVHHEHVLRMDAFYVNLVDDSVWIRMELMERSLADVVGLVCEGLSLQERMIARFASDVSLVWFEGVKRMHQGSAVANATAQVLHALEYLQKHHIAHRDVRSDNLLLNTDGIVKVGEWNVFISFSMFPIRSFR